MSAHEYFTQRLGLSGEQIDFFVQYIELLEAKSGKKGALDELQKQLEHKWNAAAQVLKLKEEGTFEEALDAVQAHMQDTQITIHARLGWPSLNTVESWRGVIDQMLEQARPGTTAGFFLKSESAQQLLEKVPPQEVIDYFGYSDVNELLQKEDVFEIFASLRFAVSHEWNDRFLEEYATLTPDDFEERETIYLVMDPEKWFDLAREFAKKKLHPLSHLKEMGIVFAIPNPEAKVSAESMMATVASLVMHYHYEVNFYARYMQRIASEKPDKYGLLLQKMIMGDIIQENLPQDGVRITHQYYTKKDDPDSRVYEPHVMPEPLHWHKGREAVHAVVCTEKVCHVDIWSSCYTVGEMIDGQLLSLNYEDNVVIADTHKTYHLYEALWNQIYAAHFSMDQLEEDFLQHLDTGLIPLT